MKKASLSFAVVLSAMFCAAEPVKMKAILTVPHEFDMLVKSGHIQGLACSEKGVYLSHQTGLAKLGWDGKLVKHIEVPGHLGGIACANGRIYGAFIIRKPKDMKDGKPGLLRELRRRFARQPGVHVLQEIEMSALCGRSRTRPEVDCEARDACVHGCARARRQHEGLAQGSGEQSAAPAP